MVHGPLQSVPREAWLQSPLTAFLSEMANILRRTAKTTARSIDAAQARFHNRQRVALRAPTPDSRACYPVLNHAHMTRMTDRSGVGGPGVRRGVSGARVGRTPVTTVAAALRGTTGLVV